jgi:hypothetical protein
VDNKIVSHGALDVNKKEEGGVQSPSSLNILWMSNAPWVT